MALRSRIPEMIAELNPALTAAIETGTNLIEARAKDLVPVNTGRLRDAIHTAYETDRRSGEIRLLGWVIAGDNVAWYGHIVEHGSVHSPAHPFLVPAVEESRKTIENDVGDVVRRVVE